MDAQDGFAATPFGEIYGDLPVETSRSQQGRIEHVRAVRGGKDDNGLIGLEAIHFHQQLLQRLFPFIIAGESRCSTTRAPNRVDFIDKYDAGSVLLGLLKEIAHAAGPDPDEEFDEACATCTIERDACLACDGTSEQGLAGTWRADQQHAFGNMCPNGEVALRLAQEVDFLAQVGLGFVGSCNVSEGCGWTLFVVEFRTAAPDSKDASSLLRLAQTAQRHVAKVDQEQDGEGIEQDRQRRLPPGNLHGLSGDLDAFFLEQGEQGGITRLWHKTGELGIRSRAVSGSPLLLMKRRFEIPGDGIAGEGHVLDIALLDLLQEAGVGQIDRRLLRTQGTKEEWG